MYTLKHFLMHYPEVTDDQVLTFCKNTGDSLDGLALHLDRARGAGVTLKEYFGSSGKAPPRTKAVADPFETAVQQLRDARAANDTAKIAAALQQLTVLVMPAAGTVGTRLSDDSKPATKDAPLTAIQQIARATMPELYAAPKKGTR